jgi:exonuclease III
MYKFIKLLLNSLLLININKYFINAQSTIDTECFNTNFSYNFFSNNYLLNNNFKLPKMHDRRINNTKLRLVQYNVEWLFLDYYSTFDCPGNCTWKNSSEALKHFDNVVNVLNIIKPDIINFCEIEGCDELKSIINSTDINYNPYLIKGTDTYTGQNVGMLTKIDPINNLYRTEDRYTYPIKGSTCNYNGTSGNTGLSKHYITEFYINDINIAFISAHLLAYPTDPLRCAEREAQSQILQNIIYSYLGIGYEVIMIGDFNDFDGTLSDINNHQPISQVLDILKGNFGDFKNEYKLYSVTNYIDKNNRFSNWYDSNSDCITKKEDFSMIDHILVSKNLFNKIENAFIYHGYKEYCGKYDSDHYPIIVDLII